MNKISLNKFPLLMAILIFSGCSSLSWLKFWGDEEEVELPTELIEIDQKVNLLTQWTTKVGESKSFGRRLPIISDEKVYFISSEGVISALNKDNGRRSWSKKTNDFVSGALGYGFKRLFYGTIDGELVALDYMNGEEIWRKIIII